MSWINILKNMGPNLSRLKNYADKVERMTPSLKNLYSDMNVVTGDSISPKDIPESVAKTALEMLDKLTFNKKEFKFVNETIAGERIRIDVEWRAYDADFFGRETIVSMGLMISTSFDVLCHIYVSLLLGPYDEISDEEYYPLNITQPNYKNSEYADIVNWRDV